MARGKGKYAAVIDKLPHTFGLEPEYQAQVRAIKQVIAGSPEYKQHATFLAQMYTTLRQEQADLKELLADTNLQLEAVSQLMTEQMEVEDISMVRFAGGKGVSTYVEPYAQVTDKELYRQWCIKDGLESQMALPWQTTNAIAKQRLLEGLPDPDGVKTYKKWKIRLLGGTDDEGEG